MAVLQILVCLYIGTCAIDFEAKLHDNEFYNVKTQQTGLYQAVDTVFRLPWTHFSDSVCVCAEMRGRLNRYAKNGNFFHNVTF